MLAEAWITGATSTPAPAPNSAARPKENITIRSIYPQELVIPAVALLAMAGLYAMQRHTLVGRAMQAVAHNCNAGRG
jgi:branched-chain amino acid transport system permease protein